MRDDGAVETTGLDAEQVADLLWEWLAELYPAIRTGHVRTA